MRENALDTHGRPACKQYSFGKILNASFERRLKSFDPNLKLVFDQTKQRWTILEWALDNSGWNIIIRAEDEHGNEKPLGEWVFNKLWVWRNQGEERNRIGAGRWLDNFDYEAEKQKTQILESHSREFRGRIVDDINQFRKALKIANNEAPSDVTAGYPKVKRRNKNEVIQSNVRKD